MRPCATATFTSWKVDHVHQCHADAIQLAGGDSGVLNASLVESAVMGARQGYHSSLGEVAAAYAHAIAKNQGYQDANKRTALLAMITFLEMNGYARDPHDDWEFTMEGVADGSITRDELLRRVIDLMGDDELLEDDDFSS
jgi:death-on-curing protein